MDLISVIVPVYNVEKYIENCITSIINQTYQNLEIILVDDGSTDFSGIICDKYSEIDNRIKVLHKKNGGVASARNLGLEVSTGEWVAFVDSDDYIEEKMYEKLYNNAIKSCSEISMCTLKYKKLDNTIINPFKSFYDTKGIKSSLDLLSNIYETDYTNSLCISFCTKIYRRHIFDSIKFREGIIYEDDDLSPKILIKDYKICILDEPLYIYVQNDKSLTNSRFSEKNFCFLLILHERIELFIKEYQKNLSIKTIEIYFNILIEYYFKALNNGMLTSPEVYIEYGKKLVFKMIFSNQIKLKNKIRFLLFLFNKSLYKKITEKAY